MSISRPPAYTPGTSRWRRKCCRRPCCASGMSAFTARNDDETYPIAQTTPTYVWYATKGVALPTGRQCRSAAEALRRQPGRIGRFQRLRHRAGAPQDRLFLDERDPTRSGAPLQQGLPIPDSNTTCSTRYRLGSGGGGTDDIVNDINQYLPGIVPNDVAQRHRSWTTSASRARPSTAFAGTGSSTFPWAMASGSRRAPTASWRRSSADGRSRESAHCEVTGSPCPTACSRRDNKLEMYGYQLPDPGLHRHFRDTRRRHRLHVRLPVVQRLYSGQPHQQPHVRWQAERHHGRARQLQAVLRAADSQRLHRAAGQCAGEHRCHVNSGIPIPSGFR